MGSVFLHVSEQEEDCSGMSRHRQMQEQREGDPSPPCSPFALASLPWEEALPWPQCRPGPDPWARVHRPPKLQRRETGVLVAVW